LLDDTTTEYYVYHGLYIILHIVALSENLFIPLFTHCRIVRRNVKYQPFLHMSELPVRCYGMLGSSTAWFKL